MGDRTGDGQADEKPVHTVTVSDFYLGKTEVRVGQFRTFVGATGYRTDAEKEGFAWGYDVEERKWAKQNGLTWKSPGFSQDDRHPVVCVSWNDAVAFAKWLTRETGKGFRLPTEAEWEYAARGGTKTRNYWGDGKEDACRYGNVGDRATRRKWSGWPWTIHDCDDGHATTAPVGTFRANPFGLFDMIGNVWEWCSDRYGEGYYRESPKDDPQGPRSGKLRVLRGGSWNYFPVSARAAVRFRSRPTGRDGDFGFRLVLASSPL